MRKFGAVIAGLVGGYLVGGAFYLLFGALAPLAAPSQDVVADVLAILALVIGVLVGLRIYRKIAVKPTTATL